MAPRRCHANKKCYVIMETQTTKEKTLKDHVAWFKYAETIGETRLYNYLMSSSILLLACATIIACDEDMSGKHLLITIFTLVGCFLSYSCLIHGSRQVKFHKIFYRKIKEIIKSDKSFQSHSFSLIIDMNENQDRVDQACQLGKSERKYRSSYFLVFIPTVMGVAFSGILLWSLYHVSFSLFCIGVLAFAAITARHREVWLRHEQ